MKALLVTETYAPRIGGGVRYEVDIINHFRGKGHRFDVLTVNSERGWQTDCENGPSQTEQGCIYRAPLQFMLDGARLSTGVLSFLWRKLPEYDLLHFNFPNPIGELAYRFSHARRGIRAAAVCFYHNDVVSAKRFHRLYNRFIAAKHLGYVDRILVSNQSILESSPVLRTYRSKVQVVPFGIDLGHYSAHSMSRSQTKEDNRGLNILFVGRLGRYKGLDILLHAMKSAPGHLTIVGQGPLESQIGHLCSELGLENKVDLLGYVPDDQLLGIYADADVLVLPSTDRGEAFGYVLLEAMAMNTALISTELGTGTSWVNQHGSTGFVIPPSDVDALVAAIRRLDEDGPLLAAFKREARKRVEEHFSLQLMLERTESLYRELGLSV